MVSVVTITYENPQELAATLKSLEQVGGIESIVVNGGMNLDTEGLLEQCDRKPQGHAFRFISEPDQGIADAFSKGVRLAKGSSVAFLNSGDLLLNKNYYQLAEGILDSNPEISFVHSNLLFEDEIAGKIILRPTGKSLGRGQPYLHPTMVVRREVFEKIGGFNIQYKIGMDFDFICRMEKNGMKAYYLDLPPVVHMDGKGISSSREMRSIQECEKALFESNLMTLENRWGIFIRYIFYFLRRLLVNSGLKSILSVLKKMKYEH